MLNSSSQTALNNKRYKYKNKYSLIQGEWIYTFTFDKKLHIMGTVSVISSVLGKSKVTGKFTVRPLLRCHRIVLGSVIQTLSVDEALLPQLMDEIAGFTS